ncbi:MAG: hypothetical protein ACQERT_04210 [Thermodesulfobacteriota bacterium]
MSSYYLLGIILCIVLSGMGLAIQAGAAVVAWISQVWGWQRRTPFLDKFGQQMLGLSMLAFLGAVLCALGSLVLGYLQYTFDPRQIAHDVPWLVTAWPLGGLGLGLIFSLLTTKTWKPLKRRKGVQSVLLLIAWLSLWAGLYVGLNQYLQGLYTLSAMAQVPSIQSIWQVQFSPTWAVLAGQALVVGLGGTGTLGLTYLLARRNVEDYGRDYYRFALPQAAKWAALLLGQPFFLAWVVYVEDRAVWLLSQKEMISLGVGLGGFVLYGLLLIIFLRSANPLRAKASALGASVLGIVAAAAAGFTQYWMWG